MGASVGGIRAGWAGVMIAVVAASLMLEGLVQVAAATSHVVGGNAAGWTIPPNTSFYDEWSSSQIFVVGDTLVFTFPAAVHNVIEVPKSSYDACSARNQIGSNLTTSPANVNITSSGTHYYICGFSGHCSAGQKLAITASSSASPTPAPTHGGPTPSPTHGGPTPSGPTPSGSTPSGTPTPNASGPAPGSSGGSNSAPPRRPFVFSLAVAFLSVASSCLLFL